VRSRLTLWYAGVLAGVLTLYAAVTLSFLYLSLRRELDATLHAEYEEVEEHVRPGLESDGGFGGVDAAGRSLVEVWETDGSLLYRSRRLDEEGLGGPPIGTGEPSPISRVLRDGTPLRIRSGLHHIGGHRVLLRVALSEEGLRHEWRRLRLGILLGLPTAVAIAGLGGHWLAGRALAPLDRLARQAERLTVDNLGERLTVENPEDELGHLARVFNLSLSRIEDSFAQLRRFTADASHELRTPLTAIRAVGEVALQDPQKPERYREAIGSMLEEADRLSQLVDSLLFLSRADAGPGLRRQEVGLLELVKSSVSLLEILAEEREQRIEIRGNGDIRLAVDPLLLRQAFINLTDNAIKYSPRGSIIAIEIRRSGNADTVVEIVDQGPGIPEAHLTRVFERFHRIDSGRSREEGGAGLGLSIALWAVQRHGGRIDLQSEEGKGSTFRIVLPPGDARETSDRTREV
jgi:heavy metal sensor kinase